MARSVSCQPRRSMQEDTRDSAKGTQTRRIPGNDELVNRGEVQTIRRTELDRARKERASSQVCREIERGESTSGQGTRLADCVGLMLL
jgi:hypothetical protein